MKGILQRLPLGGKLSRKRLMRGDKSAPTQGLHHSTPYSQIKRDSRTLYSPAPPNPPKTSLYGNRRTKSEKSFHTPTRRLPCREVRGDEGGLEGEETPPKGVSSPSKVFPHPHKKSTPPRQNAATGCGLNPHGSTRCFHSFVFGCRRRAVLRRTVSEPSSVAARSLVIR